MVAITTFSTLGSSAMLFLFVPTEVSSQMYVPGMFITMFLTMPITYYVGLKILENHHLTLALEHAADHDGLTGAATRHSFYRGLNQVAEGPHALIAIDIDHFKTINDQYGHDVGDETLRHFFRVLRRNCRRDDMIARFGGEEFIILVQDADIAAGLSAAERLCRILPKAPVRVPGGTRQLTASFGVAELYAPDDVDTVMKQADMAVYRAKNDGRNRAYAYDPQIDKCAAD